MNPYNTPVVTSYTTTDAVQTVAALFGTAGVALASTAVSDYVRLHNARSACFSLEYRVGAGAWQLLPAGKSVDLDIDLSAVTVMLRLEFGAVEALVLDYSITTKPAGLTTPAGEAISGGGSTSAADGLTVGQVNSIIAATATGAVASTVSPAFTGTPTAPTATAGTSTTQVATTAFAANAASAAVTAGLVSPALTGAPTAPTATSGDNTTKIATTAFVADAISTKAPLASPTFTGTPAVPTATVGTNTTQAASTAFVTAADALKEDKFVRVTLTNQTVNATLAAASTVDVVGVAEIVCPQTTAGVTTTIPLPAVTAVVKNIRVVNTGTASWTVVGTGGSTIAIPAGANQEFNLVGGSAWKIPYSVPWDVAAAPAAIDSTNVASYNGGRVRVTSGATLTISGTAWAGFGAGLAISIDNAGSATLAFSGSALKSNAAGTSGSSVTLAAAGEYALQQAFTSLQFRLSGGPAL